MRYLIRLMTALAASIGLLAAAPAVLASADGAAGHAVFVQTNDPAGNAIDVFARDANGSLTFAGSFATGGNGGRASGSAVDPLASQSSLVYDAAQKLLLAVNAGSNTVSVFSVNGTTLHLNQVIGSGGPFPDSIGIHGDLAYVLDAGDAGFVHGYRIAGGLLHPIVGSLRSLNLANGNPPFFLSSPAQVGFTPSGSQLVVTLKGNDGGAVDVFSVSPSGGLSAEPTTTSVGGNAFAFTFDPAGQLALVNAGTGNLSTYAVNANGSLSLVSAGAADGQAAACWVDAARGFYLIGNAGSGDLSEYTIGNDGSVSLASPVAAAGIAGAVDIASSSSFVYSQSGGSGTVHAFVINGDGSLSPIATYAVPDGGSQEGIAAS
jgi:6-phosphogluconolactonase (cycloisomerase 2 family)